MGRFVARIPSVVAVMTLSGALFGSGIATATDGLRGLSYEDASAWISSHNGTPIIGTVSGDQVETDACIVTSWHKSIFLNSRGTNDRTNNYVINLNCNNKVASPGHPGNSAMTAEGTAAKKDEQDAANINKNPAFCSKSDVIAKWCEGICHRTGLCEI